ncbi:MULTISPECIES: protein kinase domain-containing protein [Rhodococcus]|uniref:Protein kinase n=2 Tax=Rhodococcus oxybenzonivorans TaxID=1990687 RepID=A0AAE4UZ86_9NOCA|nr:MULTISPECIES: protein kinase [Rhodococcus]MDV7241808.1 protein kinase [Rhodococcus oxybenzonivorans]MDV7265427.1 protein kinase [Rhodococcus oxybenzonivorans]MDV7273658.1 protein kinase [Rhodococcus oxybenzonivorans]MDV7334090.1 protein kinase [Rhodococcus oxybenzonivorans]MDV7343509.1 protein kinase [Rhodococcus oxybenzonivorans]
MPTDEEVLTAVVMDDSDNTQQSHAADSVLEDLQRSGFEDPKEIGRGGFGVVYRCVQPALDRVVAVKILTNVLDEESRERFLREQRAMGRLTGHPNIVNALQVGVTDCGRSYIAMEHHPAGSVDEWIRRHGPLSLDEGLHLGVKIAGALETAHRFQIVHRDVKPANILITGYGEPALTDFGIARISDGFKTTTGVITGSVAFTAPEVLTGRPSDPAADVYSLGATVFAILTGHAAFERRSGEEPVAQLLRITTDPLPALRDHGIADEVSAIIQWSMAKDPAERPSASGLGGELRRFQLLNGLPIDDMVLGTPSAEDHCRTLSRGAVSAPARRAFPTTRTAASAGDDQNRGNLPIQLSSFIGRRRELVDARNLLSSNRLLTLSGVGGVGKTRLALRVAENAASGFPAGVWLVGLDELQDESLVADTLAAVLGLQNHSTRPLDELLVRFLSSKRALIVLDNCEQVVGAVAQLAGTLLRACPELRILATSREPLSIEGEAVLRLAPLSVPQSSEVTTLRVLPRYDAVALFAERAAAAVPTFELSDANRETVVQICRQLDGLPLSIELAAARLRVMSPEQVLQRLTHRFALLTHGSRGVPARQQALRWCIDWSYDLCTPEEQKVWSQLSMFGSTFELDAAEGICGVDLGSVPLIDVLTGLVDKSILTREESGSEVRYRMLETLREYGRGQLEESGEAECVGRRYSDWYGDLAAQASREWISPRQDQWVARLDREQSNFREALEFCSNSKDAANVGLRIATALGLFWLPRGIFGEGRYWLARLLESHDESPTEERARALNTACMLASLQGDLASATSALHELEEIAVELAVPEITTLATYTAGFVALYSSDFGHAIDAFESALKEASAQGDMNRHLGSLVGLALSHALRGQATKALAYHQHVLALTEPIGECVFRSYSLWAIGLLIWRQGDASQAAQVVEQGLRLTRVTGNVRGRAWCLQTLAWIAASEGRYRRAAVLMGATATLREVMGSPEFYFPTMANYQNDAERQTRRALGNRVFESEFMHGQVATFDGAAAYALDEPPEKTPPNPRSALTRREREVAELVAKGKTNREIASTLVITVRTAQGHVEHILTKLGFTSRTQIATWVVEQA